MSCAACFATEHSLLRSTKRLLYAVDRALGEPECTPENLDKSMKSANLLSYSNRSECVDKSDFIAHDVLDERRDVLVNKRWFGNVEVETVLLRCD